METAVWILAGIFALNALVVGAIAIYEVVDRHRSDREIAELEELWRAPAGFATAGPPRQNLTRRLTGVVLAAVIVYAGVAQASTGTRRVFTRALGVVVPVFTPDLTPHAGAAFDHPADPRGAKGASSRATQSRGAQGTVRPSPPGTHAIVNSTDPTVPATVAAVSRSSTRIDVVWEGVIQATGYQVERSDDAEAGWNQIGTTKHDVTVYHDAGLDSGTTYFYRISALTVEGDAAPSDVVSATTALEVPPPATAPTVSVTAITSTSIELTWVDVADETGYRVERSVDGQTWLPIATGGQDVTTCTDTGLVAEISYSYRVFATNLGGDSPPSDVVTALTLPGSPVPSPDVGPDAIDASATPSP